MKVIKPVILTALLIIVVLGVAHFYNQQQQSTAQTVVELQIADQKKLMDELTTAALVSRSATDASDVIKDCRPADRRKLDGLLDQLSQINRTQLQELYTLFQMCGSYFADITSANVAQYNRELEVLSDISDVYETVGGETSELQLPTWREQYAKLTAYSQANQELVSIQASIIESLLDGASQNSEAIINLVADGQNARESIEVLGAQVRALQAELIAS